jgi:hypothetical protein
MNSVRGKTSSLKPRDADLSLGTFGCSWPVAGQVSSVHRLYLHTLYRCVRSLYFSCLTCFGVHLYETEGSQYEANKQDR